MCATVTRLAERLTGLLPWRFRSRNNFRMATANRLFMRVLPTPAQPAHPDSPVEIHSLVCHRDVNMMLTSAKSLLRFGLEAAVILHDDGSLTEEDCRIFLAHLPGARIIRRAEADAAMRAVLPPAVFERRQQYFFLLKLFDFNYYNQGTHTILLDSDIVFLRRPQQIMAWVKDARAEPFFNLDWCPSYRARRIPAGLAIPERLNAGFMGYRGRFSMEDIYRWGLELDYWLEDQTFYALLLAGKNARALPPERYCVYTGGAVPSQAEMVHFISPNRFTGLLYPKLASGIYEALKSAR